MKNPKIEDHHANIPVSGMENKKLPESNQDLSIFPKTLQLTLFLIQECRTTVLRTIKRGKWTGCRIKGDLHPFCWETNQLVDRSCSSNLSMELVGCIESSQVST
jgi:hypothetical protein